MFFVVVFALGVFQIVPPNLSVAILLLYFILTFKYNL